MTDPSDFSDRVAVVTGAGRGIGARTAELLVAHGARTALVARRFADVAAISRQLQQRGGVTLPLAHDLTDPAAATAMLAEVAAELGPVDLLVNNAASIAPLGPTVEVSVGDWAATVQLDLVSPLAAISAVLPHMLKQRFGRIINVSSGAADGSGSQHANAYSVSKAGLEMLTRNLAVELVDTGVTVAAVRPGRVDTDMQRFLRSQRPDVVGSEIVRRAWAFRHDAELVSPSVPAELIVRMMRRGHNGAVVSIYDGVGRSLLADLDYVGNGVRPTLEGTHAD